MPNIMCIVRVKYKWTGNTKKDNTQLKKENPEIRFQLNDPTSESKNNQYTANNGGKGAQLNPITRQGGVQPSTANGRNYVQPSTANVRNYVQPSTANGQATRTMTGYTNTERTGHDYAIEPYSRPSLDLTQGTELSGRNVNRDLIYQEVNVLRSEEKSAGNNYRNEPNRSGYIQQEPNNAHVNLSQNPPNMGENRNKVNQENAGSHLAGAGLTVNNEQGNNGGYTNNIESNKSRIKDRSSSQGRKIAETVNPLFRYFFLTKSVYINISHGITRPTKKLESQGLDYKGGLDEFLTFLASWSYEKTG